MNKARYRRGDCTPVEDKRLRVRQNNVVLEQMFCPNSTLENADHEIMALNALRNISTGL